MARAGAHATAIDLTETAVTATRKRLELDSLAAEVLRQDAEHLPFPNTTFDNITLAGCWAHARGNFYEAREQAPQRCGWILRQIGHLYRIEDNLRRSGAGPRKRAAKRMSQNRPICQRLHRALVLFKKSRRYLPRSAFGQAIDYALSNWPLLGIYEDGRIEIDNNLVENSIRPTALGKKNWLFFGDADAGQRSAILYTITESCRCRGIDPHAYLRDVLTRLSPMTNWQVKNITPEAWAKASRSPATATAA